MGILDRSLLKINDTLRRKYSVGHLALQDYLQILQVRILVGPADYIPLVSAEHEVLVLAEDPEGLLLYTLHQCDLQYNFVNWVEAEASAPGARSWNCGTD